MIPKHIPTHLSWIYYAQPQHETQSGPFLLSFSPCHWDHAHEWITWTSKSKWEITIFLLYNQWDASSMENSFKVSWVIWQWNRFHNLLFDTLYKWFWGVFLFCFFFILVKSKFKRKYQTRQSGVINRGHLLQHMAWHNSCIELF